MFPLARLSIVYNSLSSFAILNACTADLECFLITCLAIFSLNTFDGYKSILCLFLHCCTDVPQSCNNSLSYLYITAGRVPSLCYIQFIRARLECLAVATLEYSDCIFSFRESNEHLCKGDNYKNLSS